MEEIVRAILAGEDALAIMPTGAGKSICYQVPALMLPGITIVVSPLISLMQDQVKALNEAGIHAAFINSSLTEAQIAKAMRFAAEGRYKIIYVAPERLESAVFMQFAQNGKISMVTVDEAHCISQWGQDFRPSYLKIVSFIDSLADRPVVSAFTATATREVRTDIECTLKLHNPRVVVTGFDRENLYYSVEHITGKHKDAFILDYIQKHADESGIIYCATRKNVDNLYEKLSRSGISAARYHAGLDNDTRKKNQEDFIYDRVQIVIATNALGMGIDKSNVRFVIHYNMPQSMENYYQEAGRAGRDGESAQCILLFSVQDVMIDKFLLEKKEFEGMDAEDIELVRQRDAQRLQVMEGYCKTTLCLRNYILEYFGERASAPCDNCGNCHQEYYEQDMTSDAKWVVNCIAEMRGRYGLNIVLGTLLGANRARLKEIGASAYKSYGILKQRSEKDLRLLVDQMLAEGYIVQTGEYSVLQMGDISRLKEESTRVIVRKAQEREDAADKTKNENKKKKTDSLTSAGYDLFDRLRQLRLVIAKEEAMPPYIIFSDKTLIDMCAKTPGNQAEMLAVSGVGENKYQKYGERFIQEIAAFPVEALETVQETEISETSEEEEPSEPDKAQELLPAVKAVKTRRKDAFYLNREDAERFQYVEYCYISDIKERMNQVCTAVNVKKATISVIWEYLVSAGLVAEEQGQEGYRKVQTEQGLNLGIKTIDKISQGGYAYQLLMYPETVQRMIVEYFVGAR